jgi:hypothetical protein
LSYLADKVFLLRYFERSGSMLPREFAGAQSEAPQLKRD